MECVQPPRPPQWEEPFTNDAPITQYLNPGLLLAIPARLFGAIRSIGGEGKYNLTTVLVNFLRTRLYFPHDDQTEWIPYRTLGSGGFGRVAQWVRKDDHGDFVDELALKEIDYGHDLASFEYWERRPEDIGKGNVGIHGWIRGLKVPGLLQEAVIQKQLNEFGCDNILHLRGYSFVTKHRIDTSNVGMSSTNDLLMGDKYRLFLEFAPYRDLAHLINLYKAWDTYLPEPFLWHVFDSLAAALQVLQNGPRYKFLSSRACDHYGKWPPGHGVVHLDLKPRNIFLSYEHPRQTSDDKTGGTTVLGYPVIKLGDFGLSDITGPSDKPYPNPQLYWRNGTTYFQPPEQIHYGVEFGDPPNGRQRYWFDPQTGGMIDNMRQKIEFDDTIDYYFGNKHNVWSVGKTLYDLATLSYSSEFCQIWAQTEAEYTTNDKHFIRDWTTSPFAQSSALPPNRIRSPYSQELTNLIRDCLKPSVPLRIGVDELRVRTMSGLETAIGQSDVKDSSDDRGDDRGDGGGGSGNNGGPRKASHQPGKATTRLPSRAERDRLRRELDNRITANATRVAARQARQYINGLLLGTNWNVDQAFGDWQSLTGNTNAPMTGVYTPSRPDSKPQADDTFKDEHTKRQNNVRKHKLYFRGHEINDMSLGDDPFPLNNDLWDDIMDRAGPDDDWPQLRPPRRKWQPLLPSADATTDTEWQEFLNPPLRANPFPLRINQGQIVFRPPNLGARRPHRPSALDVNPVPVGSDSDQLSDDVDPVSSRLKRRRTWTGGPTQSRKPPTLSDLFSLFDLPHASSQSGHGSDDNGGNDDDDDGNGGGDSVAKRRKASADHSGSDDLPQRIRSQGKSPSPNTPRGRRNNNKISAPNAPTVHPTADDVRRSRDGPVAPPTPVAPPNPSSIIPPPSPPRPLGPRASQVAATATRITAAGRRSQRTRSQTSRGQAYQAELAARASRPTRSRGRGQDRGRGRGRGGVVPGRQ